MLIDRLANDHQDGENVLFWQTKSLVQPKSFAESSVGGDGGGVDEFTRFQKLVSENKAKLWEWSTGTASSELRKGAVDAVSGRKEDYQHLMTSIP